VRPPELEEVMTDKLTTVEAQPLAPAEGGDSFVAFLERVQGLISVWRSSRRSFAPRNAPTIRNASLYAVMAGLQ
jgi:hypothetical protein